MPESGLVTSALISLHQRYQSLFEDKQPDYPAVRIDDEWRSLCLVESANKQQGDLCQWKPVVWGESQAFDAIQDALGVAFHPDVIEFYTSFWSDGFKGQFDGNGISIIQIWNEDDLEMLKQNLLGHVFATQKNKVPTTIFIGCTDNDIVISVDNETGKVGLERPGYPQHHILADNLAAFLDQFEPGTEPYTE